MSRLTEWLFGNGVTADQAETNEPSRRYSMTLDELARYIGDTGYIVRISPEAILRIPEVYSAVSLIAASFAALNVSSDIFAVEAVMTRRFNDAITADDGKTMMLHDLLLQNNAYAQIVPSLDGVSNLQLIPYQANQVRRLPNMGGYTVTVQGQQSIVPTERMLHVIGFTRNARDGLSLVDTLADLWRQSIMVTKYGNSYFEKGGTPSGIITVEVGRDGALAVISEEDRDAAREAWNESRRGEKAGTAFLPGPYRYTPVSESPEKAQFLGTNAWLLTRVARVFHVPPVMLGHLDDATLANHREQRLVYASDCIMPLTRRWMSAVEAKIPGANVQFDLSDLTRQDTKERYEAYQIAVNTGWLLRSEIRVMEGLEPLDGIDNPGATNDTGSED